MAIFDFLKKKLQPQDRYAGKPFLKLVDSFVLKCIDELDVSQENLLLQMTPKLQKTFSHTGSWEEIVMDQLHLGPDVRTTIRTLWAKNQEIAKQNGVVLSPMQFVEMFVANNVTDT